MRGETFIELYERIRTTKLLLRMHIVEELHKKLLNIFMFHTIGHKVVLALLYLPLPKIMSRNV